MRLARNIALAVVGLLAVLIGVVAVRTALYQPPGKVEGRLAAAPPFDRALAATHLGEAIRIPTISHQDPAEDDPAAWFALHAWLQTTYPRAHAAMTREVVAGRSLIYTWPGADPALAPIVLMAHQDVVPITPGTESAWRHPPFGGVLAGGEVWGRGAIDDKGSLVGLFEATEALAAQGFKPRRTILIVAGHDEERGGSGAQAIATTLKARGIKAQFVLDEGMATIADHPVTGGGAALIGVAEKGYATLRVTARAPGGHSSTPPKETGVVVLAKAVQAIAEDPFPMRYDGPAADMMRALASSAGAPVKAAVANAWLTRPLLVAQISATPAGAAMLHTTIAPTMLKGSPKENVLPQDAAAWINYRIAPGDTSADVMARAKRAVGDLPVEMAWEGTPREPSPVSSIDSPGWRAVALAAGEVSGAPVAPALVIAATDSRFLAEVADDVYRYQPLVLPLEGMEMIHGTNERLSLENLDRMVRFYAQLIATAAR